MICLLSTGSIRASTSEAAWELKPKGYVLPREQVVGEVEDARKMVTKLETQGETISIQDRKLADIEEAVREVSKELAIAQEVVKHLPEQVKAEVKTASSKARAQGILIGFLGAGALAWALSN